MGTSNRYICSCIYSFICSPRFKILRIIIQWFQIVDQGKPILSNICNHLCLYGINYFVFANNPISYCDWLYIRISFWVREVRIFVCNTNYFHWNILWCTSQFHNFKIFSSGIRQEKNKYIKEFKWMVVKLWFGWWNIWWWQLGYNRCRHVEACYASFWTHELLPWLLDICQFVEIRTWYKCLDNKSFSLYFHWSQFDHNNWNKSKERQ